MCFIANYPTFPRKVSLFIFIALQLFNAIILYDNNNYNNNRLNDIKCFSNFFNSDELMMKFTLPVIRVQILGFHLDGNKADNLIWCTIYIHLIYLSILLKKGGNISILYHFLYYQRS